MLRTIIVCAIMLLCDIACFSAELLRSKTDANVPIEITLPAAKPHNDPFNTVQVDVLFTDAQGATKLVPAFWAGNNVWKVRYASPLTGLHRWRSRCNDDTDKGLNGVSGTVEVAKYRGTNLLFKHGPLKIAEDKRHFEHADGTPFFWLGDTWWMGLCKRLSWPDDFKKLAAHRKQQGYNVIQIVAGLYPDMHPFDPRGANEAGFPWETNYTAIRPEYFDAADTRLRYLIDEGFTPCIVGAWGYFLPWMGEQRATQHWRELIARYGSWPVVWCIAGEANLPWYLAKGFPYDDRELVRGWTEVTRYARKTDPFHRPMTIHPTGIGKLNARWAINDASLIDFDMLQTPHGQSEAVGPTIAAFQHAYNLPPKMPVLNGEASYEMLNGQITAQWPRAMFWLCMMNGAAGHTYGGNGIWQVNRRDQPHGASPHGGNYGTTPWDEAMHFAGGRQIALGKKFLAQFPWNDCVPRPETVQWEKQAAAEWGSWIWFPEGDAKTDAPVAKRYFRRAFEVPTKLKSATLRFTADDRAVVWLNGEKVAELANWQSPQSVDVTKFMRVGKNLLAIQAENLPAPVSTNPAGLNVALDLKSENSSLTIVSDALWQSATNAGDGWNLFDNTAWAQAVVTAPYGGGPWGRIADSGALCPPFALGIRDKLRIVYAISPGGVLISGLRPNTNYRLTEFDAVTGETVRGKMKTDEKGHLRSPSVPHSQDWVIALER